MVSVLKNLELKTGISVEAMFSICLHEKDIEILKLLQNYFEGVGTVNKAGKDLVHYRVTSLQYLIKIIIPHFDKYSLTTQKRADFELFKMVVEMMSRGEHLTNKGIQKIVAIKASMNLGLSEELKKAFPTVITVKRPLVEVPKTLDPN